MIGFVAFSIRRAWQGFWRNGVMSIAATATMILMLMLLAGFWVIQSGMSAGLEYIEAKVQVVAELNPDVSQADITRVQAEVNALPEVSEVEYVTPDMAKTRFQAQEAAKGHTDLTQYLNTNPFPATLQVHLRDPRNYGSVVDVLKTEAIVKQVQPVQSIIDRLLTVTTVLRTAGVVILALVGITVLFIIINTIRLAVIARASEIEIMRLVGASDAFVRWPFIFEGALVGLIGSVITLILFGLAAEPLSGVMTGFFQVLPLELGSMTRDVVVLILASGLGLGSLGAWLSVRSYLAR
ncbi:MAG TPA: permease-like cell division protein FtsX [Candidatus Acidoferrum sp.]|nr:permease-like cell division protein FtsX [Candidatus Acidoferrum sp.]